MFLKRKFARSNSNTFSILLISFIFIISILYDLIIKENILFLPLLISSLLSASITKWSIPKLNNLNLLQTIRSEGPKKHLKKSGTTNLGGIVIIPIGLIIGNIYNLNNLIDKELMAISFISLGYMSIGLLDDLLGIKFKNNIGLKSNQKLIMQAVIGIIFLSFISSESLLDSKINLWNNSFIDLGIFLLPVALFAIVAESNSTNLTDGLDGLASGCGAIIFTGISIELILRGGLENYGLASFCMAMTGSWLGFLIFNKSPARIFMGDTGSLSMGATLAGVALISNTLWSLLIMGIVFLAESVSVILQVGIFKATKYTRGKGFRLFRMAPLHHHFELKGNKEIEIVHSFWLISLIFVCLGLVLRSNI